MKSTALFEHLEFREESPNAQALYVDKNGRVIRFTLKPGQSIKGHQVPDSPFYVVVLQGHGRFMGREGTEHRVGPNDLLIFDPGEEHSVVADDEELVFVGFLHGASANTTEKVGGELGRQEVTAWHS
jgi:quercetin dioxygenase-like cupin family protein